MAVRCGHCALASSLAPWNPCSISCAKSRSIISGYSLLQSSCPSSAEVLCHPVRRRSACLRPLVTRCDGFEDSCGYAFLEHGNECCIWICARARHGLYEAQAEGLPFADRYAVWITAVRTQVTVHYDRQFMSVVVSCDGVIRVPLRQGSCDVLDQVLFTQVLIALLRGLRGKDLGLLWSAVLLRPARTYGSARRLEKAERGTLRCP